MATPPRRFTQLLAIAILCGMGAVILHKAVTDIVRLAGLYSGGEFWRRLARYVLANLAG